MIRVVSRKPFEEVADFSIDNNEPTVGAVFNSETQSCFETITTTTNKTQTHSFFFFLDSEIF